MSRPLAYFLTWTCYGQRLHGDIRGSVDHLHNSRGTPTLPPDAERETFERDRMTRDTFELNTECAAIATDAIQRLCEDREWDCLAVNVRQTHVHVVVSCPVAPERAIADFKARITRDLRRKKLVSEDARLWTIHGSTRWINHAAGLYGAISYVNDWQSGRNKEWREEQRLRARRFLAERIAERQERERGGRRSVEEFRNEFGTE